MISTENSIKSQEKSPVDEPVLEPPSEAKPTPNTVLTTQAILCLIGAFCAMFCSVGFLNAFGVFQEYYKEHQLASKSDSDISWLAAVEIFCIYLGSGFTGLLVDLFGPNLLLLFGSIGTLIAIFMTSLCKEYYQFFLAQGLLLGLSLAGIVAPTVAVIALHFRRTRALALGITIAGSSMGGVIWPIVLHSLFGKKNVGFGWTVRVVGFIMLPLLIISCLTVRGPAKVPSTAGVSAAPKKRKVIDLSLMRNPVFALFCAGLFFLYFGLFAPFFFITSYSSSMDFSADLAFYLISIVNGASAFGRILPGVVADKWGRFNIFIMSIAGSGIVALCWTKATTVAGVVIFALAYGFVSGAVMSLQGACAAECCAPENMGTAIGLGFSSASLSALAGTPISGQLAGQYGYLSLSIYSGVSLLVGATCVIAARMKISTNLLARV